MDALTWTTGLTTERMGRRVVYRDVVASTNAEAAAALRNEVLAEGTAFVASRQTGGRGTGDNRWHSDDDEGLCLSLVLQPPVRQHPLSFLPGIALVDVLRADYDLPAWLKWPNDVYLEDRKLSGILVESQRQPDGRDAWVVGIGVNVNQASFHPEVVDRAVSLKLATGREWSRPELFRRLMAAIEALWIGGAPLVPMWRERTEMLGARVRARRGGAETFGTVEDVTAAGHLLVRRDDGEPEEWVSRVDFELVR